MHVYDVLCAWKHLEGSKFYQGFLKRVGNREKHHFLIFHAILNASFFDVSRSQPVRRRNIFSEIWINFL